MDNNERKLQTTETGSVTSHSAGFLEFKKMAREFREVTKQIYKIGRNIEEQHMRIREQMLQLRRNDIDKLLESVDVDPSTDNKWKGYMCEIYALGDNWSLDRQPAPWEENPLAAPPPPSRIPLRVSPAASAPPARRSVHCPNGLAPEKCLCQKPK